MQRFFPKRYYIWKAYPLPPIITTNRNTYYFHLIFPLRFYSPSKVGGSINTRKREWKKSSPSMRSILWKTGAERDRERAALDRDKIEFRGLSRSAAVSNALFDNAVPLKSRRGGPISWGTHSQTVGGLGARLSPSSKPWRISYRARNRAASYRDPRFESRSGRGGVRGTLSHPNGAIPFPSSISPLPFCLDYRPPPLLPASFVVQICDTSPVCLLRYRDSYAPSRVQRRVPPQTGKKILAGRFERTGSIPVAGLLIGPSDRIEDAWLRDLGESRA